MRVLALSLLASLALASSPVVLPMRMEKNLPLVDMKVNGTPLTFIVDSAAAGCVIDGERASSLGLKKTGNGLSSGSGGVQPVGLLSAVRLELGSIVIEPRQCVTFDMKSLRFTGTVDGILGHPLFESFVVEIDYPGSVLRIYRPDSFRPSPTAERLPLRMTIGPVVRGSVRVAGREPIEADMQLDTGSAHVVTLCTPFVDRHKLLDSATELLAGRTRGFGGASNDMTGRIEEVRVGRFVAEKPMVRFSRQTKGSLGSEQHYSANLGGAFLKDYKVTFDLPRSRLYLEWHWTWNRIGRM